MMSPTIKSTRNFWAAGSLLAAGLLVTLLVVQYEKSVVENEAKRGFVLNCMEIQARIQNRLAAQAQILRGGAAFFAHDNGITRQEWREFAERQKLDQNFPGIQGIGFMVLVPPGELSEHVRKIRAEGFPDYRVKPDGEREVYAPVIYLEPFSGLNLRAFGYDTFSEPVRREAMERARDNDEAALSGKVLLLQETGTDIQAGVLMYVPAYRPGLPHGTVAERRAALLGWAYIACRMNDCMEGILGREDFREKWRIHLKVFDGATSSPEALLYNSDTSTDEKSETGLTRQIPIDAAGHEWLLSFSQSGGTGVQANYGKVWLCLGSGTMISLLLSGLFFSLQNTRFNARRQAEKLTADLRQRKAALKESEANFRSFFETVTDMIIVGTTDGRTLFTNSAVTQTLGYTPEELARMPLLDLHPADLRPEARKIFAAMFRGERATCPLPLARKDGVLVPVETRVWLGRWNAEDCIFGISKNLTAEQEAQQRFERLFRRSPAIMAVSKLPERRFSDVNDAFLATLGYSREEVIGKTAAELGLFPNPDQVAALTEMLLANRRISNIELQVRCKNGEIREGVFCGEVIISQGRRHFLTVMLDITERMKAIEELKKERRRLEGIIEATHVGTWEHNGRAGATVFNDRWAEIIGYTLDGISPVSIETWIRFAHPDDLKASNALLEKHCRGELDYYEFELRMKHKDGRWVWVLDRGKVVSRTNDGQPLMVMGTHQDITARKDMERELHEALERAEASARAKADFLSVMSHELRNPLNGVLGFAELLSDSPLDEEQREWAQAINSSGNHLLAIVNDILDFSSLAKGTLTIHPAPFAVAELVKRVA